ncbi:MAG: hypothetical protein ABIC40_07725 [bacterium]
MRFSSVIFFICMIGFLSLPNPPVFGLSEAIINGFGSESILNPSERLDAVRFLQARIRQPELGSYYLVRGVRVLLPILGSEGVFSYLVTCQSGENENGIWDLGDYYSVRGYYIIFLSRTKDEFKINAIINATPPDLLGKLGIKNDSPPPPKFLSDEKYLDYTGAVFNATDPEVIEWREKMVEDIIPRFEWKDMTGDGRLDCILDIEGFNYEPSSFYTIIVSTDDGFEEGFRSSGDNTDFSEFEYDHSVAVRRDRYSINENGQWLLSWQDYFILKDGRFVNGNGNFAGEYSLLIPGLKSLADDRLGEETDFQGRWFGKERYVVNATRYATGESTPYEYYFNLARIAEYSNDTVKANEWWEKIIAYMDEEYSSQERTTPEDLNQSIRDKAESYDEWRDEFYAASEAALSGD